jgi:hypothetical protein
MTRLEVPRPFGSDTQPTVVVSLDSIVVGAIIQVFRRRGNRMGIVKRIVYEVKMTNVTPSGLPKAAKRQSNNKSAFCTV